jgi:single-strand DNA-binding protein
LRSLAPRFHQHNDNRLHKEEHMNTTATPAVNTITLAGNLVSDPVLRELPDGSAVCDMRLAVGDSGEQPLYIDVATFGTGAQACAAYLVKGRAVAVTGRLAFSQWTAKDGAKRSKHHVIGRVSFGARPVDDGAEGER